MTTATMPELHSAGWKILGQREPARTNTICHMVQIRAQANPFHLAWRPFFHFPFFHILTLPRVLAHCTPTLHQLKQWEAETERRDTRLRDAEEMLASLTQELPRAQNALWDYLQAHFPESAWRESPAQTLGGYIHVFSDAYDQLDEHARNLIEQVNHLRDQHKEQTRVSNQMQEGILEGYARQRLREGDALTSAQHVMQRLQEGDFYSILSSSRYNTLFQGDLEPRVIWETYGQPEALLYQIEQDVQQFCTSHAISPLLAAALEGAA